ncbi:FK506-binding protein 2 [Seminavis robusta]|uniref:peptidylprolyl isomerase n=1 Tax=Seminavis robusta TaxID=568900 RepID=A0A9N8DZK6_9STRA|nr:FK506-binding protein 2 [Seminavis robusta]|eukprot:Sro392_g133300.1 FK506-binding protein 2 (336) ;mRNA; r:14044-15051
MKQHQSPHPTVFRLLFAGTVILFLPIGSVCSFSLPQLSFPDASIRRTLAPTEDRDLSLPPCRNSRRDILNLVLVASTGLVATPPLCNAAYDDPPVVLRLDTPEDKAGLVLYEVTIGSPSRKVVAIKQVLTYRPNLKLQPGLVLKDWPNAMSVLNRIRQGPYPIELQFYNLDASNGELGEALTAQDALTVAVQTSKTENSETTTTPSTASNSYVRRVVKEAENCRIKSRRDDVLEINYTARLQRTDGIIYDASEFRGTGRPYQMVLGSGDMLPGVDQGVVDMCPGEQRVIEIPPNLAYGQKGNKLFRIPPNTPLVWEVELVSVNSVRQLQNEEDDD